MPLPFQPDCADWLNSLLADGRSASTIDCYGRDLRDLASALGSDRTDALASVDQRTLNGIAATWGTDGASPTTVYRRLSALRGFALFLTRSGRMRCGSILAAAMPEAKRTRRPILTDQQTADLLSEDLFAVDDWADRRDLAMLALGADGALTAAEMAALNRQDLGANSVCVRASCFRPRVTGVSEASRSAIDVYLGEVPFDLAFDGPLFVNQRGARMSVRTIQVRFCYRARRLGIIGPHGPGSLRTRCGDRLATEGQSPALIAAALGLHPLSAFRFFGP